MNWKIEFHEDFYMEYLNFPDDVRVESYEEEGRELPLIMGDRLLRVA